MTRARPLASPSNEDIVVQIAVDVLIGKGSIEPEDVDDDLIATLRRLYRENPICQTKVVFTDDAWRNMYAARPGEYLAAVLHHEWQEEWERSLPLWTCACGATFKLSESFSHGQQMHRVADGMLGDLVGSVDGRGHCAARNRDCPDCGRAFAGTIARREDPQLGLFEPSC